MAFDGTVLAAVCSELAEKLIGGRIEKIYQPEKDEVVISIHNRGDKYRLLVSANSQDARIHLSNVVKENPLAPPMFCMVLRKHLEGGKISDISQHGLERVLQITVSSHDEIGELAEKKLITEIMGKHSNIILVDSTTGVILDGIKRYSHAISRHREVLPGRIYLAPPEQGKLNPLEINETIFRRLIAEGSLEAKVANTILNSFEGISPQLSREIVVRANLNQDIRIQECGDYELNLLWGGLASIIEAVRTNTYQPSVYFDGDKGIAFSAVELHQYNGLNSKHGTASEVLDLFFSTRLNNNKVKQRQNALLKQVEDELDRNLKKIAIQDEAIAEAGKGEEYKIYGELLTANLYQLEKGQTAAEVVNYYDPKGSTISIPLNIQFTPAENAQDYYKKYNKAKSTIKSAGQQRETALKEANYLETVKQSIEQAATTEDLQEVRDELIAGGYIKEKPQKGKKIKDSKIPLKPMTFISTDGMEILVGKNNRQNDLLTLRIAGDNDLWLHVKDIPGSHVIIRSNGKEITDKTLLESATLAAYYSKARESSNVPVDYTEKKHVHKPRGAKPGMVIYTDQKTLFITPDSNIIDNLQK